MEYGIRQAKVANLTVLLRMIVLVANQALMCNRWRHHGKLVWREHLALDLLTPIATLVVNQWTKLLMASTTPSLITLSIMWRCVNTNLSLRRRIKSLHNDNKNNKYHSYCRMINMKYLTHYMHSKKIFVVCTLTLHNYRFVYSR